MNVVKVFNNNAVLAAVGGADDVVVLMGRGIGFGVRPGQPVEPSRAERTFVPAASGPAEHLAVAEEIVGLGRAELGGHFGGQLAGTLAGHLSSALRRARNGREISCPLRGEVLQLYPREVAVGRRAIGLVADRLGVRLPDAEAIWLALYFVNAQLEAPEPTKAER